MTIAEPVVRHVGEGQAPWVDTFTGVDLQVLRVDVEQGLWVIRNRFRPGVRMQVHKHTGTVEGYTFSGAWRYLEYDFVSTAGSYIWEPAGSVHTLDVPATNTEDTEVLFVLQGALLYLDADGAVESVVDAESILDAYLALCDSAGLGRPSVLGA